MGKEAARGQTHGLVAHAPFMLHPLLAAHVGRRFVLDLVSVAFPRQLLHFIFIAELGFKRSTLQQSIQNYGNEHKECLIRNRDFSEIPPGSVDFWGPKKRANRIFKMSEIAPRIH